MQRPPVWSAWSPLWTIGSATPQACEMGGLLHTRPSCVRTRRPDSYNSQDSTLRPVLNLAHCLVHADDHALPGRTGPAGSSEVDDLIAEALALGEKSKPVPWAKGVLATRAWFRGDTITAIQLFDETRRF